LNFKRKAIFLLICFSFLKMNSQSNFDAGLLPKIVLSKKIDDKTKWVNSIESRAIIYDDELQLSYNLVDISSILSIKTSLNQSFNFGYILRFRDSEIIHRTFQHYNFVNQLNAFKVGHRFAFEQFYQSKRQTTFRTRYRISAEKALNGEKVDVKEFYLKLGNEYLYDFEGKDLEVRLTPYLGYKASEKDRIEFGLDYRIGDFINNATENNLWFRVTWYYQL